MRSEALPPLLKRAHEKMLLLSKSLKDNSWSQYPASEEACDILRERHSLAPRNPARRASREGENCSAPPMKLSNPVSCIRLVHALTKGLAHRAGSSGRQGPPAPSSRPLHHLLSPNGDRGVGGGTWGPSRKRGAQEAGFTERKEPVLRRGTEPNVKRRGGAKVEHRGQRATGRGTFPERFPEGAGQQRERREGEASRRGGKGAGPAEGLAGKAGPAEGLAEGPLSLCGSPREVWPAEEAGQGAAETTGAGGTADKAGPHPTHIPPASSPPTSAQLRGLARSGRLRAGSSGRPGGKGALSGTGEKRSAPGAPTEKPRRPAARTNGRPSRVGADARGPIREGLSRAEGGATGPTLGQNTSTTAIRFRFLCFLNIVKRCELYIM